MASDDTHRLIEIVGEAVRRPIAERESFVRASCPDAAMQEEAMSLLRSLEDAGGFMERPTLAGAQNARSESLRERPGTTVGKYRLIEQIGEGGFGVVFMAEQQEPVRRMVALKIIKLGMDTKEVVARFEQERQALALMDHPGIAKVFDAGASETGRPFFAMELVRGEPITQYCLTHAVSTRDRLELFREVCRAVQHAHTKGIIHRDLKPGNVLVTTVDGKPMPKVIDFGVAKATSARLTEKTLFTQFRQFIGTPEYMSPEQAGGDAFDVDARTDVYSLGVLLYELLTGGPPFDPARLRSAAWGELQRIIREEEPPKPSTRLSAVKSGAERVPRPGDAPTSAISVVRGDLDWIVMRCLEKERDRRYETADALAADVQRHLAGEPVAAAPPSAAYRARKFVRRHRIGVIAGGCILAALVLGFGAALWQAIMAGHERDAARLATATAVQARKEADDRRKETEQIAEFQSSQLGGIKPSVMAGRLHDQLLAEEKTGLERAKVPGEEAAARQAQFEKMLADVNLTNVALKTLDENIFDRAITSAHEKFADQPLVMARLLETAADSMTHLGLLEHAQAPQMEVVAIRRKELGNEHKETMAAINNMGYYLQLQGKFAEAEPWFREALDLRRRVLGPDHPNSMTSMNNMGMVLQAQGKLKEAEPFLRETLDRRKAVLGEGDPGTLQSLNNVAWLMYTLNRLREAEAMDRKCLELTRKALGEDHADTLESIGNLGVVLEAEGKMDEAEPLYVEALQKKRRILGDDHPDTLDSMSNLGFLDMKLKRFGEAEALFKEAIERDKRVRSPDHPSTLSAILNYAALTRDQGRWAESETLYREALAGYQRKFGANYWLAGHTRVGLGRVLTAEGRYAEAETELLEGERILATAQGSSPARHAAAIGFLVALYQSWDKAEPGHGHDAKAQEWKGKAEPTPAAPAGGK